MAWCVGRRRFAESFSSAVQRGGKTLGSRDKLGRDGSAQEMVLEPDPHHVSKGGETFAKEEGHSRCRHPCSGRMFQTSQSGIGSGHREKLAFLGKEGWVGRRKGIRNLPELVVLNPTGKKMSIKGAETSQVLSAESGR